MFRRVYGSSPASLLYRFRDQFEEDGNGGYIYRRWRQGPPIPVTAEERTNFVNRYTRNFIILYGLGCTGGVTFFMLYMSSWRPTDVFPSTDPRFWIGMALSTLPFLIMLQWVGYAPARALKTRPSIGPELSPDEIRAEKFRNLSYGYLLGIALVGAGSYVYIEKGDWGRQWLFVPILGVLFPALQAFRKWRAESRVRDIRG